MEDHEISDLAHGMVELAQGQLSGYLHWHMLVRQENGGRVSADHGVLESTFLNRHTSFHK